MQVGTGGSLTSTIRDLTQWAKSGTGDVLLSDETLERRHMYSNSISSLQMYGITKYMFASEQAARYGLEGWVGHDGDAFGFASTAYKNKG